MADHPTYSHTANWLGLPSLCPVAFNNYIISTIIIFTTIITITIFNSTITNLDHQPSPKYLSLHYIVHIISTN